LGKDVVVPQDIPLGMKVNAATRFRVTTLLVPPEVATVTLTEPGSVKLVVPFPRGTTATMPVSDHPAALGTTVATMLPWVKVTCPGALLKPLPLISIGSPTGPEAVVELLIFKIEGTVGGVEPVFPPPQATRAAPAANSMTAPNARLHLSCIVFLPGAPP
jgi:hypothetical protein